MPLFHTSPYATEQLWEGPKGLSGTTTHWAKALVEAIAAGSANCTQVATVEDKISLAYLKYVAILDFVLHRVIVCHNSAHDGVPVKEKKKDFLVTFCHFMQNDLFSIAVQ